MAEPARSLMNKPRSRTSKRKRTRQPSPDRINLNSKRMAAETTQPVAGPSRLPMQLLPEDSKDEEKSAPPASVEKNESFTAGDEFIPLAASDDEESKQQVREWDLRKRDWDGDEGRGRERDDQIAGKKRRREDFERDDDMSDRRASTYTNVDFNARKAPWTVDVNWKRCRNVAQMLHEEVQAFVQYISPTRIEHEVRSMIVQLISHAIKNSFPDADVKPFGSFGTKLYLPQGDIDLVVISNSMANMDRLTALRTLANIVRRTDITDKVTVISKAKVPIIKFVSNYGNFSIDISLNQGNGVQAGKMINHFLEEFPPLRAIVLVVKSFLNQRSMNEVYSGGLGSYAIVCLVVSFLQLHPKLRRAEIDPSRNLGVLVMDFFELYGKYFNYGETGISLRHGGSYFNKSQRGWRDYDRPHLLSIEDPGDISNDISKGSFGIRNVRQTFSGAFEIMKTVAYERAEMLSARKSGRYVDLRGGNGDTHGTDFPYPEEMSILSSILGISQKTINQRRIVQEVYDDGHLARLLGIDPRKGADGSGSDVSDNRVDGSRRSREAQTVVDAWAEADMVLGSSDEEAESRQRMANGTASKRPNEDDESRYGVRPSRRPSPRRVQSQDGPSRKRQRTEGAKDVRGAPAKAIFVADDDDDDSHSESEAARPSRRQPIRSEGSDSDDSLAAIERVYAIADRRREEDVYTVQRKGADGKERTTNGEAYKQGALSSSERRAYWASKSLNTYDSDNA